MMGKKLTTEEFIVKAMLVHGGKYDYSNVEYVNVRTKVCIICKEHGEFWQRPSDHLRGVGCMDCSGYKPLTTETFTNKAIEVHNNKFSYSKSVYKGCQTKVCITCPIHGDFWQTPHSHLRGIGCPKCGGTKKLTTETFIDKAIEVHGDKFGYSKSIYINNDKKLCITCPIHGDFWQTPHSHLNGKGCIECGGTKKLTTETFIDKAIEVHGDKFGYSNVVYNGNKVKVCIICPTHGEFYQIPNAHLNGCGCPSCNESKIEKNIKTFLIENKIDFEAQKKFEWLGLQSLDFYLPKYNVAIECQGEQHFKSVEYFGGEEMFKKIRNRDIKKFELCNDNGVKLLYYSNLGIDYPYEVFEDEKELLIEINKVLQWV